MLQQEVVYYFRLPISFTAGGVVADELGRVRLPDSATTRVVLGPLQLAELGPPKNMRPTVG